MNEGETLHTEDASQRSILADPWLAPMHMDAYASFLRSPSSMDLKHLRSFCMVAEEEHVTRAAKRLHLSQPALTQQIRSLEVELGVRLVHRAGRGIEISPAGRCLQKEAPYIFHRVQGLGDKLREIGRRSNRVVVVALSEIELSMRPVTDLLSKYRAAHPEVTLSEKVLRTKDIADALRKGQVDAALSCGEPPETQGLRRHDLGSTPTLLGVPAKHPLSTLEQVRLEQIAGHPLILLSCDVASRTLESKLRAACAERGIVPQLLEITSNVAVAVGLVAANAGVALFPYGAPCMRDDAVSYKAIENLPSLSIKLSLFVRHMETRADVLALNDLALSASHGITDAVSAMATGRHK